MRPAPIVPLEKDERAKHSGAELRFSDMPRNRSIAGFLESIAFTPVNAKPSQRRRIRAEHPWYRMKRLPDGAA